MGTWSFPLEPFRPEAVQTGILNLDHHKCESAELSRMSLKHAHRQVKHVAHPFSQGFIYTEWALEFPRQPHFSPPPPQNLDV